VNTKRGIILLISLLTIGVQSIFSQSKKDYLITIQTKFGAMNLVLFDKTPKHKTNFLKLIQDKTLDSTLFHRVIKDFMIQGGDPNSKNAKPGQMLGMGGLNYKVPAEILPELYHQKGALGAASDGNPEKASSSTQFYIVQGRIWNDAELQGQIARSGRPFTEEQKNHYKTVGGSPHLDGNYTVFGQMISGLSVLDAIANVQKGSANRPIDNISMMVTAKKMRKKKIIKKYADKTLFTRF
jgi:cyclophilin family peptidyl-prolyl cis-trans isomerase